MVAKANKKNSAHAQNVTPAVQVVTGHFAAMSSLISVFFFFHFRCRTAG